MGAALHFSLSKYTLCLAAWIFSADFQIFLLCFYCATCVVKCMCCICEALKIKKKKHSQSYTKGNSNMLRSLFAIMKMRKSRKRVDEQMGGMEQNVEHAEIFPWTNAIKYIWNGRRCNVCVSKEQISFMQLAPLAYVCTMRPSQKWLPFTEFARDGHMQYTSCRFYSIYASSMLVCQYFEAIETNEEGSGYELWDEINVNVKETNNK